MLIGGFMRKIRELEGKIGYCFQDQELLKHCLLYTSEDLVRMLAKDLKGYKAYQI